MDDEELNQIRQQRLAQLQAAYGSQPSAGHTQGAGDRSDVQKQQAKEREAEMRNSILGAVLTQEARARLSTIAIAKPERAKMVENIIIQHAQMGQVRGKINEDILKDLLEKTSQTKRETKVSYERRRVFDDDDENSD